MSAVSYVEVLGYHPLEEEERQYLEAFFRVAQVLPLSQAIPNQAVALRQQRNMSLGDALVAGTTLVHGRTLVTRHVEDFRWMPGLLLWNPFDAEPQHEHEPPG